MRNSFLIEDDSFETIEDVLDTLRERDKNVIERFYFDGVKLAKIAKEMGVSAARVGAIKRRGLRCLRHPTRLIPLMAITETRNNETR